MLLNEILKNLKLPYSISEKEFCQYRKNCNCRKPRCREELEGFTKILREGIES
jgi:hypothetical protein